MYGVAFGSYTDHKLMGEVPVKDKNWFQTLRMTHSLYLRNPKWKQAEKATYAVQSGYPTVM